MIDIAVDFLNDEVNSYIRRRTGSDAVQSNLSPIVDELGKYAFEEDTLAAFVINIEEERVFRAQKPDYVLKDGQHVVLQPEIKLNLHLMFAAHFKLHEQSLKYLSLVLTCFQATPSFTSQNHPGLDPRIHKLRAELLTLSYEQLNQVWAYIGGKYLPSVIYKVRLIVLQDDAQTGIQPPVREIDGELHGT